MSRTKLVKEVAEPNTYIKLYRNLLDWKWRKKPKTKVVWIYLLLRANIEPHEYERVTIQRGQVMTGRREIAEANGLTEQEVRTALNDLKSTGEITIKSSNKGSIITIVNFDKYQGGSTNRATSRLTSDQPAINQQTTNSQPASNQQSTSNQPLLKNKRTTLKGRRKKEVCESTNAPTLDEVVAFFAERGRSRGDAEKFHEYNSMRNWMVSGTPIVDWQAAAEMWIRQGADTNGGNREPVTQTTQPAVETDDFGRPIKKPCTLSDLGFNPADYMTEEELNGS